MMLADVSAEASSEAASSMGALNQGASRSTPMERDNRPVDLEVVAGLCLL